ncbi:MAG: hypothetical protein MUD07_08635 [Burkholderiaceae bacterium]|jgi:hypothetical protein|nr:hypothetical protein [Burkholderiaceae bacterium]
MNNTAAGASPVDCRVRPAAPKPGKRLTAKQKRMRAAILYLRNYMDTYETQHGCLDYRDETLIDDVLYALGCAFDDKAHRYANGYEVWKKKLLAHLCAVRA